MVLDTVREEYLGQERRHSLLISKTQTLATVAALFFTVTTASGRDVFARGVFRVLLSLGYALAVVGVAICIYVLRSKEFHKVRYAPALEDGELQKEPETVMVNLAKTYDDAIKKSETSYNTLVRLFDKAILILLVSVIFGGSATFSTSLGEHMSNEKPETQAPPPASLPKPQTASNGTDSLKKSENPPKTNFYGTQKIRGYDHKKKP